jgi:putative transposase
MKVENPWLSEVNSQSLQKSLMNLDTAFTNFFRRVKNHDKDPGFPVFKKKRNRKWSKDIY